MNGGFYRPVRTEDVREGPLEACIEADEEALASLAARFDLIALETLEARLLVAAQDGGLRVTGRFEADVVQRCVRSLAPVPAHISEPVDILFLPGEDVPEEEIDPESALDLEPLTDGIVDLAELVGQSLGLALDPYPRAADTEPVRLVDPLAEDEDPLGGSFAILKELRDKS